MPNLVHQYPQRSETTVLESSGGGIHKLACSSQLPMIGTKIEPSLIFGRGGNPPFVLAKGVRGRRRFFVWAVYEQRSIFRPDRYCFMTERTNGGVSGFARMRWVVLVCKRPILCFVFMIVQAVLRLMPSAFACWSSVV